VRGTVSAKPAANQPRGKAGILYSALSLRELGTHQAVIIVVVMRHKGGGLRHKEGEEGEGEDGVEANARHDEDLRETPLRSVLTHNKKIEIVIVIVTRQRRT